MEPGIANDQIIGDPVTREDVAEEIGANRHPFHLMRKDVREAAKVIGFTRNCRGCEAVELGYSSRPMHSDECRSRMEEQISKTTRGKARMVEFEKRLASDVEARVRRSEVDEEINKPTRVQATGSGDITAGVVSSGSIVSTKDLSSTPSTTQTSAPTTIAQPSTTNNASGSNPSIPLALRYKFPMQCLVLQV